MVVDLIKSLSSNLDLKISSNDSNKLAAVLVVIYGKNPFVIMTEKPKNLKFHAGEISFPGGKFEKKDSDLLNTAIRETQEEIGLSISRNQIIGQLDSVTTLNSGYRIFPFVSVLNSIPPLTPNYEVEKIFHIPLIPLLKTMASDPIPEHNMLDEMYTFEYKGNIIWGASARILKQIANCLNI